MPFQRRGVVQSLILIRHGQARHQSERTVGGWSDVELTDLGHRQARRVAKRLTDIIDSDFVLLVSDLVRAMQTAQPIAEQFDVQINPHEKLREIKAGIAEGTSRSEAHRMRTPAEGNIFDWRPYPGAETWREFDARIQEFMAELYQLEEEIVVIVAHSQTIVSIIHNWLNLPEEIKVTTDFWIDNCSLTILKRDNNGVNIIQTLNDIGHLDLEHELDL